MINIDPIIFQICNYGFKVIYLPLFIYHPCSYPSQIQLNRFFPSYLFFLAFHFLFCFFNIFILILIFQFQYFVFILKKNLLIQINKISISLNCLKLLNVDCILVTTFFTFNLSLNRWIDNKHKEYKSDFNIY
jgi:hypothetical protein